MASQGAGPCRSVRPLPASTLETSRRLPNVSHASTPQRLFSTTQCPPTSASPPPLPMHPVVSLVLENAYKYHQFLVPLLFSVFGSVANIHEPVQHTLFITAVSWAILWLPIIFKTGIWSNTSNKRRRTSWLAGGFLAFAQICDRAACDKDGTWATKVTSQLIIIMDRF